MVPSIRTATGSGSQRLYSFKDLAVLKVVKNLLDTGVSLNNIRLAVEQLRRHGVRDLARITLFSDGVTVYECTSPEEVVDLLQGGQGVFGIAVGGAMREISGTIARFPAERADAGGRRPAGGRAGRAPQPRSALRRLTPTGWHGPRGRWVRPLDCARLTASYLDTARERPAHRSLWPQAPKEQLLPGTSQASQTARRRRPLERGDGSGSAGVDHPPMVQAEGEPTSPAKLSGARAVAGGGRGGGRTRRTATSAACEAPARPATGGVVSAPHGSPARSSWDSAPLAALEHGVPFAERHIGPDAAGLARMLETIGVGSLEELADTAMPTSIRPTPPTGRRPHRARPRRRRPRSRCSRSCARSPRRTPRWCRCSASATTGRSRRR